MIKYNLKALDIKIIDKKQITLEVDDPDCAEDQVITGTAMLKKPYLFVRCLLDVVETKMNLIGDGNYIDEHNQAWRYCHYEDTGTYQLILVGNALETFSLPATFVFVSNPFQEGK